MARIIEAGPDQKIREQLESLDPEQRRLVYTIPQGVPFPVTGYRATMTVDETAEGSDLTWACEFEPDGVPEEEARKAIEQMYGVMIGFGASEPRWERAAIAIAGMLVARTFLVRRLGPKAM